MSLTNLVKHFVTSPPRYDSVEADYHIGTFSLTAREGGRTVRYDSAGPYRLTTSSPLLGRFSERMGASFERQEWGPTLSIVKGIESVVVVYDRTTGITIVQEQEGNGPARVVMEAPFSQYTSTPFALPPDRAAYLIKQHQQIFNYEAKRLDVKRHRAIAKRSA